MSQTNNIRVNGNALELVSSELRVEFPWPIAEVLEFNNVYVLRIKPDAGSCFNENVFGVAWDGKLLWQIEARQHVYGDSPYTCLIKSDDKAKLFNWDGDELIVEPQTGKILSVRFSK